MNIENPPLKDPEKFIIRPLPIKLAVGKSNQLPKFFEVKKNKFGMRTIKRKQTS